MQDNTQEELRDGDIEGIKYVARDTNEMICDSIDPKHLPKYTNQKQCNRKKKITIRRLCTKNGIRLQKLNQLLYQRL